MSHKDDRCFQCQEAGHIACHCPNICCFECDEYGHIVMACPDRIPPSDTPAHHHRKESNTRHCPRSSSRHHLQDRYRHSRSRSKSPPHRYQSYSHHNSHRCHSRSHHRHHHSSTLWCHHSSTFCYCHDTPHQTSSSHRSTSVHSRDHSRSWSHSAYKPNKKTQHKSSSCPSRNPAKYSTYQNIEDSLKIHIQPTTAKLNTGNGSPMTALGMTALHLRIAEFKFTHNFVACDRLPDT